MCSINSTHWSFILEFAISKRSFIVIQWIQISQINNHRCHRATHTHLLTYLFTYLLTYTLTYLLYTKRQYPMKRIVVHCGRIRAVDDGAHQLAMQVIAVILYIFAVVVCWQTIACWIKPDQLCLAVSREFENNWILDDTREDGRKEHTQTRELFARSFIRKQPEVTIETSIVCRVKCFSSMLFILQDSSEDCDFDCEYTFWTYIYMYIYLYIYCEHTNKRTSTLDEKKITEKKTNKQWDKQRIRIVGGARFLFVINGMPLTSHPLPIDFIILTAACILFSRCSLSNVAHLRVCGSLSSGPISLFGDRSSAFVSSFGVRFEQSLSTTVACHPPDNPPHNPSDNSPDNPPDGQLGTESRTISRP